MNIVGYKEVVICMVLGAMSHFATGQAVPKIPETYGWTSAEEYHRDLPEIKKCLHYLCIAPLADTIGRSVVNAYVLEWLSGSPELSVDIDTRSLPFLAENEELIFPVIHGMALYQLEHPKEKDNVVLHAKGLKVLAALAESDAELKKAPYLREIFRAAHRKKLESWVCSRFNA